MTGQRWGDRAACGAVSTYDLTRFLDDLRRTGTVISRPVAGEPESPWDDDAPVEWLVEAHRGQRVDPPYRLRLDEQGFDAALLGVDRTPHGFLRRYEDDRIELTAHHLCPNPAVHLPAGMGTWSAYQPGTAEFDDAFGGEVSCASPAGPRGTVPDDHRAVAGDARRGRALRRLPRRAGRRGARHLTTGAQNSLRSRSFTGRPSGSTSIR